MEPHGDDSTFDEPLKQPKLEPNAPGKGIDLPESTMHAYDDQHSSDQIYMPEEPREEGSPERGPEQITPVQQRGGLPKLVLYGDVSVHPCKVESLDQTNVQQHDGPQELVLYGSVNVQPHEEKGLDQTQQPQEGDDICSLKQKHQDEDQQGREITSPDDEMLAEESDLLVPGLMEQPHREHQLNGPQQDSTLSEVHMIAHEGKQPFPGNVNTSYDQREHLLPSQSEQCLLSLSAQIPSGADTKLPLVENDIESSRKLYLRDQPEIDFLGGSSRSGTMIKSEEQKQYHFCYGSAAAEGSTGFLPNGHEAPDLTTTAQLPAAAPSHHHHTVVYARSDAIKMEDGGLEEVTLPYVGQTNWETGKLTRRPFEISSSSQNNIALASNAAVPIEGMTKKQLELLSLYANSLACASAGMGSAAPNTLGSFETVAAALKTINDLGGSEEVAAALKALQELQNSEDIGEIVETVDKPQRSDHDGTPATGPEPNPFAATAPEQKQAIFSDEAFFSSQSPIDGTHLGAAPGVSSGTVYVNESHQYESQQPTAYMDESQQHESQQPKADTTFSQFGDVSRESFSDPESQGAKECRIRAEILAHPTFPEMLAAHVACLRVTVPEDHMLNVPDQLIRSQELLRVYSAFLPPSDLEGPAGAQRKKDLDQFMRLYTDTLWDLRGQLERYVPKQVKETLMFIARVENEAKNLFASCQVIPEAANNPPESDVNKSTQSQSAMEEYASAGEDYGPLVPTGSERTIMEGIRNQLKQQYGEEGYKSKILEVRDEILRKRRAGKLPTGTIAILKEWWNDHIDWPYPTEDDKERFMEETGLEIRQINNWFINQRKRNWNNGASSSKSNDRKNKQKQ